MDNERGDIIEHTENNDFDFYKHPQWLKKSLENFMDRRFGLFLHWGPYCQWDCCESWPLVPEDTWARPDDMQCWKERNYDLDSFTKDYFNLNKTFNPVKFDPDYWAELADSSGFKYLTFTTKHHDGFCMFDTKTTEYKVTNTDCPYHHNPNSNIVKKVFDAFRSRNMSISCYFSKSDWHTPHYWSPDYTVTDRNPNYDTHQEPERWQKFVDFVHEQFRELMTDYGNIDVLWLDGGQVCPPEQDINMAKIARKSRILQPGLIIADRTVGGEFENFITPEQRIPDKPLNTPWESCLTLGHSWKYVPGEKYKSADKTINMLAEIVAKGGNLLLGVGPDPQGLIPKEADVILRQIGKWLSINGEAIYKTHPIEPYSFENIRFTQNKSHIFAIILELKKEQIANRNIIIPDNIIPTSLKVKLLGYSEQLTIKKKDQATIITLPEKAVLQKHNLVLRFK